MTKYEEELVRELRAESEKGNRRSMEELATFYFENHPEEVAAEDIPVLVAYYEKAVEEGNSRAMLNLGALYYNGVFVEQKFKKAMELYQMAADSENDDIAPIALGNLGYCHYYGRDTAVNYAKAFECFLKGAIFYSDPACLCKLGDMFKAGKFVEKNGRTAFLLYEEAEKSSRRHGKRREHADCVKRLAEILLDGMAGVERDPFAALKYLSEAQGELYDAVYRRGDPFAEKNLASVETLIEKAKNCCKGDRNE